MTASFHTRPVPKGNSIIELVIAFAVLTLTLTAVISVFFGNQSAAVDTETATEALARAHAMLEYERTFTSNAYLSASSTNNLVTRGGLTYTETMSIEDMTPCEKQATASVAWNTSTLRPQKTEVTTYLVDILSTLLLGGDCDTATTTGSWALPNLFASDTVSPAKATALDVLDGTVYMAVDTAPFLKIASGAGATLHQSGGLFIQFTTGFNPGNKINSIDVFRWTNPASGDVRRYIFATMNTSANQLKIIDVTVPSAPLITATLSLSSCVTGSFPQGWYAVAYGNRLYLVTRETAGPELHIIDISTPSSPTELSVGSAGCRGFQLNDTVEEMVVRDQPVNGIRRRYAYLATDESNRELRVLDVTDPYNVTEVQDVDLPGIQDGSSLYVIGSRLYFGRLNVSTGPELYVFDVTSPVSGLIQLATQEIGADVLSIRVENGLAFLGTRKNNKELQVWNIQDLSHITNVSTFHVPNLVSRGVDYEAPYLFVGAQTNPTLQVLYTR